MLLFVLCVLHMLYVDNFYAMLVEMCFYKHTRENCDVDELSVTFGLDLATSQILCMLTHFSN